MTNKSTLINILEITKKLRLLYVEDSLDSRTQALKMLEGYFSYIDVAVDGISGIEQYKNHFFDTNNYYDLVVTDINMPKMNGIDMSKAIYEINKNQKVIIVSAYNDSKYFIDLINIGVEGFLQKPISFEDFLGAMDKLCKNLKNDNIITLEQGCSYDMLSKKFICNGLKIYLTNNEQKFIELHLKNHLINFSLEEVFNHIYYDEPHKEFSADAIKGLVKRLRKKLPTDLLKYSRTFGYTLAIQKP